MPGGISDDTGNLDGTVPSGETGNPEGEVAGGTSQDAGNPDETVPDGIPGDAGKK